MRVTWHPGNGLVILSLWDGDRCLATFRLPQTDVSRLASFLVVALGDAVSTGSPAQTARTEVAVNGD